MPTSCTYNLAQMPLSSIGLEVWITKRQQVQNVLVHHTVLGQPFAFRHGPANCGFGARLTPRRVGVERPGTGVNERPRVIHRAMVEGGPSKPASSFLQYPQEPEGASRPVLP